MSEQLTLTIAAPEDKALASSGGSASDPLKPSIQLLIKLGSALVHIEEMRSYHFDASKHEYTFDAAALSQTVDDPAVQDWIAQMTKLGFMPVKR